MFLGEFPSQAKYHSHMVENGVPVSSYETPIVSCRENDHIKAHTEQ